MCKLLKIQRPAAAGPAPLIPWFYNQLLINLLERLSVNSDQGWHADHADGKTKISKSARSAVRVCVFLTTCNTLLDLRVIAWPIGSTNTPKCRPHRCWRAHTLAVSCHDMLVWGTGRRLALHAFAVDFKPHLFSNYTHSEIKIFPSETSKKEIKYCI